MADRRVMGRGLGTVACRGIRRRRAWARPLPFGLLPVLLLAPSLQAAPACRALQEQRDRLVREAMQAEIALVQTIRRRLCPREEALAEQANAIGPASGANGGQGAALDFGAYIRCREQAERQLGRTHPVLYTNRQGFVFYSAEGGQRARAADALLSQRNAACPSPPAGPPP